MTTLPTAPTHRHPLSPMQRPLYASQQRQPDAPMQNMVSLAHIDGAVDGDRLAEAFASVVAASDVLRTAVRIEGEAETVVGLTDQPARTEVVELARDDVEKWVRDRAQNVIPLTDCAYDSVLLRHADGTASWYLALHHLVTDATGSAQVFQLTSAAYDGHTPETDSYYDWAASLSTLGPARERALDHWASRVPAPRLGHLYERLPATTDATRHPIDLGVTLGALEARLSTAFRSLSPELAWTEVLLTATAAYLHRITDADAFALGVPVHNRSTPRAKQLLGPLVEVFPVDIVIEADDTFATLHRRVRRSLATTLRFAQPGTAPAATDVEALINVLPGGDVDRFGPFPATFGYRHSGSVDPKQLMSVQLFQYHGTELALDVNHAAVAPHRQTRAVEHYLTLLERMAADPDEPIGARSLLTGGETTALDAWGQGPRFVTADERPTIERLRDALRDRDDIALTDGDLSLSGRRLWRHVEQVASELRSRGLGPGDRVAIEMDRSIDAVTAILAVMWAGASYVPVDPAQPAARRRRIIERAGCALTLHRIAAPDLETEALDPPSLSDPDEVYVLFTSGSTGEPKGVPISQRGLREYLDFAIDEYLAPEEHPVAPLFSSLTFDLTVTSLFVPLLSGGRLIVCRGDGPTAVRAIADHPEITWAKATPSHLELLLRMLPDSHALKTLVVGGEAFSLSLAERLRDRLPGVRLINSYGPTEAVVACMVHHSVVGEQTDSADLPIGAPAPGVNLAVVDRYGHRVPPGAVGELLITRRGLTTGYLDDPIRNAASFVGRDGERWYRSGDLVRMIDDQTLVYMRRADHQLKVGGIRLDPSEIETALTTHERVRHAAARLWSPADGSGADVVTAWVVPRSETEPPSPAALRAHLQDRLPAYAIPAAYVVVSVLPISASGKLDVNRLPAPDAVSRAADGEFVASTTPTEAAIIDLWQRRLGVSPISVEADFFALGGDSLAALEMTMVLGEELGLAIPDAVAFSNPTPRGLAAAIDTFRSGPDIRREGPTRRAADVPPLSAGEQAMLFEYRAHPEDARYNQGRSYTVATAIDADRLRAAVETVAARHQPLSWTYATPRHRLVGSDLVDFRSESFPTRAHADEQATELFRLPFDLEAGPLLRCSVAYLPDDTTVISLATHHVSSDEASYDVLWREIDAAYQDRALPEPAIAYADLMTWQAEGRTDADIDYWLDAVGDIAALRVPRPSSPEPDGLRERPATISADELRRAAGSAPFATVLAALGAVLRRYCTSDEITVGALVSTRDHPSAADLVGYHLNTLPLTLDIDPAESLLGLRRRCATTLAGALAHRTVPFADIVARHRAERRPDPMPQVLVALQEIGEATFAGAPAEHEILLSGAAVADATFFVQFRGDRVALALEHRGAVVDSALADQLLADLDLALTDVVRAPSTLLRDREIGAGGKVEGAPVVMGDHVVDAISAAATADPAAPAVICGATTLSWGELDTWSHDVAQHLVALGVVPGDRVVVALPRSPGLVAAILGTLRAGAAYVPVDPSYPVVRNEAILAASGASIGIVDGGGLTFGGIETVAIESIASVEGDTERPDLPPPDLEGPAYVIYTSGSTGTPRGVEIRHRELAISNGARRDAYPSPPERFLWMSSPAFDSSVAGLFWTLTSGGTLVIPLDSEVHDIDLVLELIERTEPTHTLVVPSLYQGLLQRSTQPSAWFDQVVVAGEACPPDLAALHHRMFPGRAFTNEYGPTEATVWTTFAHVPDGAAEIPIGTPIAGSWAAVVTPDNALCPPGVIGELVVGGPTVAVGYDGATEPGGFRATSPLGPGRAFHTGDLVSLRKGQIYFHGRIDDQLNVGGLRVEPGEIEAALEAHPAIANAVVTTRPLESLGGRLDRARPDDLRDALRAAADADDPVAALDGFLADGPGTLVAHLEAVDGAEVDTADVRRFVGDRLPPTSRPKRYGVHPRLPRLPNGKVDRRRTAALPLPEQPPIEQDTSPDNEGLDSIVAHFRRALGQPTLGADADFFDEGGDSLTALELLHWIEQDLGLRPKVSLLFEARTPRRLHRALGIGTGIAADASDDVTRIRQGDSSAPPLWLLSGAGGVLLVFEPLVERLPANLTINGLEYPGTRGEQAPLSTVEELGAFVHRAIRAEQPDGPYRLLGYSLGGLVAIDVTRRLREEGHEVSFLGAVEAGLAESADPRGRRQRLTDSWRGGGGLRGLTGHVARKGAARVRRAPEKARRRVRATVEGALIERFGVRPSDQMIFIRMLEVSRVAGLRYAPPRVDVTATLFLGDDATPERTEARVRAWKNVAGRGLDVRTVDGSHIDNEMLIDADAVRSLAAEVTRALDHG